MALFLTCIALLLQLSCVDVPIAIKFEKPIVIIEDSLINQSVDLREEVNNSLDLGIASTPEACTDAFTGWLEEQFKIGLVPKRIVTPLEYGKKSLDPLIEQCKSIDLALKIPSSWQKLLQQKQVKLSSQFFHISKVRENLEKRACLKSIMLPESKKISLINLKLLVIKNSLNIKSPVYKIYYTTKKLSTGTEQELLARGDIKYFGITQSFAPGFKGEQKIVLTKNSQELIATKADLIAFPQIESMNMQTRIINQEPFYIIPKGDAELNIEIDLDINININDARCLMNMQR